MKGWVEKSLGELCEIARGGSPRPIQSFLTDDPSGINWIKISDATASGKYIYRTEEKIKPEGAKRSRVVKEGDFLLSNSMSFGRPYIMKTTGCIHDGWLVLSDKSGLFEQDYLYYFLGSSAAYRQFDALAAGSTVRNLNIDLAKKVRVPVPPLAEQRRIVTILEEAFAGLEVMRLNAEKNLQNACDLFDSELNAIFTQEGEEWITKPIAKIATKIGSGATPKGGKDSYKADGVSLIRSMNVHDRNFKYDDLAFLDDEQAKKLSNVVVHKNDVLLNITGASVARCCQVPDDVLPARVNQHVSIIRPIESIVSSRFMEYALTARPNKDRLLGVGEKGGSNSTGDNEGRNSGVSAFHSAPCRSSRSNFEA